MFYVGSENNDWNLYPEDVFFPGTEFLRCEMPVEMSVVSGPTVLLQSSDTGNGGVCHQYNSSKANIKGEGWIPDRTQWHANIVLHYSVVGYSSFSP